MDKKMDEMNEMNQMDENVDGAVASAPPVDTKLANEMAYDSNQISVIAPEPPPPPYSEEDVITQQPGKKGADPLITDTSAPIGTTVVSATDHDDRDCCDRCCDHLCAPSSGPHCYGCYVPHTHSGDCGNCGGDCGGDCSGCCNCGSCGDIKCDNCDVGGEGAAAILIGAIACFICIIAGVLCYECFCKEKEEEEETAPAGEFTYVNPEAIACSSSDVSSEGAITKQPSGKLK